MDESGQYRELWTCERNGPPLARHWAVHQSFHPIFGESRNVYLPSVRAANLPEQVEHTYTLLAQSPWNRQPPQIDLGTIMHSS
jgi:hypothetical protein